MSLLNFLRSLFGASQAPRTPAPVPISTPPPAPRAKPAREAYRNFICAVVGESFSNPDGNNRQNIIRRYVRSGDRAALIREPDNRYDSNAVAVYVHDHQIGYLKSDVAERLAELVDDPAFAASAVVEAIHGGTRDKPSIGVTLDLTVYKTGLPSLVPRIDGVPTYEILHDYKDDLAMMLRCCDSEEETYLSQPEGRRRAPAPAFFVRAAILSRKAKDYQAEVTICERWLRLATNYQSQPIVQAGKAAQVTSGPSHENILKRLPKAKASLAKQAALPE